MNDKTASLFASNRPFHATARWLFPDDHGDVLSGGAFAKHGSPRSNSMKTFTIMHHPSYLLVTDGHNAVAAPLDNSKRVHSAAL